MSHIVEFEWDQWNSQKNEIKHGVSKLESESVFFDPDIIIFDDIKHSNSEEQRAIVYWMSKLHRVLMVAFTIRDNKIRIISARVASKNERDIYENKRD